MIAGSGVIAVLSVSVCTWLHFPLWCTGEMRTSIGFRAFGVLLGMYRSAFIESRLFSTLSGSRVRLVYFEDCCF